MIQEDTGRLTRRLGTFSAASVLVGSTIGSGIFRVPSSVVDQAGTLGASSATPGARSSSARGSSRSSILP
jgi:hypothetical protein